MRYWDDKDGQGRPLVSGRVCLVIDAEDGTNPLRTYGASKDEVLDKLAGSVETGQATIQRLRTATPAAHNAAPPSPQAPARGAGTPAAPRRNQPTPDEVMVAAADITNPGKAAGAFKTLARAAGMDVDAQLRRESASRVARVGRDWNAAHPEFPDVDRYSRLLIDRATRNAGFDNITAEVLDQAYAELLQEGWTFEPEGEAQPQNGSGPTAILEGTPGSRVVRPRMATSYVRTQLSAPQRAATPKPKYTRAEFDAMNTRDFKAKVLDVPEVLDAYNREFSGAVA